MIILRLALFSVISISVLPAFAQVDIPVVPIAIAKKDLPPVVSSGQTQPSLDAQKVEQALSIDDRTTLEMSPGVNEIVPIAVSHLNRLVTPFEDPIITSSNNATYEIRENVIYIGTETTSPVTLYITESGSEDAALSLTLIPQKIPPRQFSIRIKNASGIGIPLQSKKAKNWETSQPYLITLENLLRDLALGKVPAGYSFLDKPDGVMPQCRQNGIDVKFGLQTVAGHYFTVHIGLAQNNTTEVIEFDEDACSDWDIAAVSAFPNLVLQPGQKTEVYVVQKRNYQESIKVERKSLLGGF